MSTRQYIGARYVPKFFENSATNDPTWAANTAYEPLTIVTYNGNSYTSKKTVPAGIGNPSANAEYWASTGLYNAQVETLREEVETLAGDVSDIEERVSSLEGGDILLIGDSYVSAYTENWAADLASYLGKTINTDAFISARSGCGFSYTVDNVNFATLVNSAVVPDDNNIRAVIFGGGANDIYNDAYQGIEAGIRNAVNNVKSRFPNAKIYIANVNAWINSGFTAERYIALNMLYEKGSIENNCMYLGSVGNRLRIDHVNLLLADKKHPNTAGMAILAKEMFCAMSGHSYKEAQKNMGSLYWVLAGDDLTVNVYSQISVAVTNAESYTANGNTYFDIPINNYGLIGHSFPRRFITPCYVRYNGSNYTDATLILELGTTGLRGAVLKINDAKTNFETLTNLSQVTLLSGTTFVIPDAYGIG